MAGRPRTAQENLLWVVGATEGTLQPREALWSVPGADTPLGGSALVFVSPLPVYMDRRNVLDPENPSG